VWVTIEGDSSGPDGTPISNGTSAYRATGGFDATGKLESFTFATPPTLAASTTYWAVLQGDYDVDASNCISFDTHAVAEADQICDYYDEAWAALALKNLTCNVLLQVGASATIYTDGFEIDTGANLTLLTNPDATEGLDRAEINGFPDYQVKFSPLTTLEATRSWFTEYLAGTEFCLQATLGATAGNIVYVEAHDLFMDDLGEGEDREGRLAEAVTCASSTPEGSLTIDFK